MKSILNFFRRPSLQMPPRLLVAQLPPSWKVVHVSANPPRQKYADGQTSPRLSRRSRRCGRKTHDNEVAVVGKVRPSLMLPKPPTLQVDMPIQSESQGQLQRGVDSPRTEETVHIRECRRYLAFKRPSRRVLRQNQRERARRYGRDVAKLNADENRSRSAQDDNDRAP